MSWTLFLLLVLGIGSGLTIVGARRIRLARTRRVLEELADARERGSREARLQYPHVDLSRCLGCGTCVAACPEEGVLDLLHGQAVVVHGARCVGHGRCAEECPTGAIVVTLGDLEDRRDIPAVDRRFESTTVPGLFLAGEVTGFALIRTAITHGQAVAREVAARVASTPRNGRANGHANGKARVFDLLVVGAGPAGISCAVEAQESGLEVAVLEQETLGGTVASYPRGKLVLTQPVTLPGGYRLARSTYGKEELMELWERIAHEKELAVYTGVRFQHAERGPAGEFEVATDRGTVHARNVCLAVGRRGTPRKLGVPGEELPKVCYSLLDAQSFQGRRILVVGGGDSAIEAALGLAEQEGNAVTLSYRRPAFFRLKARNEQRIEEALREGRVTALYESRVTRITPDAVELEQGPEAGLRRLALPNDDVFVLAGGDPPFKMLEQCGVSFDPADRVEEPVTEERSSGLFASLLFAFVALLGAGAALALWADYYTLAFDQRPSSPWHEVLRPAGAIGLALGIGATALLLANLAYLLRRSPRIPFRLGSLRAWMTAHVATGLMALVCALMHSAMAPRDTVGGYALLGLGVLAATGAVGRYFYSFVPRAANGRELDLEEVRAEVATLASSWDEGNRAFADRVRAALTELVPEDRWSGSLPRRLALLMRAELVSRWTLARLRRAGRTEGIAEDQLARTLALARRAQRCALGAAHFGELQGLLATWRYLHRWVALLLVLLVAAHVFVALRYGGLLS